MAGLLRSIIHANTSTDHAIAVMADLQKRLDSGIPETQAEFLWGVGDSYEGRYGLWASVARQTSSGRTPFGTAQSVDIHAALRSYAIWAARQLFLEKQTGSLELGKAADLAIWGRDPYSVPTDQLRTWCAR
jgi:Amidohydrolase family